MVYLQKIYVQCRIEGEEMIIKNVSISNFKGIEECTIDLKSGMNLVIGDNGYGKTSILEAISVCLGGFIAGIEDVTTKHFLQDEIRVVLEETGSASYNKRYITPISVACKAEIEGQDFEWTRRKNSVKAARSTVEPRDVCKKAFHMANGTGHVLPILSYQSTARMWMQKKESSEDIFAKEFYRTVGYEGCLAEASNIKMMMNWIRRMERIEWKTKKTVVEYKAVKDTLCRFMNYMEDGVEKVEYDEISDELVYSSNNKILPIRNLSSGYQSLIWMVLDIAYRMAILNPDMLDKINETPGVVLIDELDMHLHPKWQWNIVSALKKTFPNVQFIAATHSSIIISSCKQDNLITIDKDGEISYAETPYGFDVNEILSVFQETFTMPEDVENLLKVFYQNLDAENYDEAEEQLQQLKEMTGENNPKITSAEMALELEQIPLED